jgi:hypothetical protein
MLSAVTDHWVIGALFAAVAGFNSGCSVTPVSVRETSRRLTVHGEAANLRPSPASLGKISSGQIVEKVDLNRCDRIATKGFSRSGLGVQRIVLAEHYEIKGLAHRHRTPGEGQAAAALSTPQPQSPLRTFYTADYVYVPVTIMNPCGGSEKRDEGPCFRIIDDESSRGHSMGGLLAKSLVCDSGDNLWDSVFTVRPERLTVS